MGGSIIWGGTSTLRASPRRKGCGSIGGHLGQIFKLVPVVEDEFTKPFFGGFSNNCDKKASTFHVENPCELLFGLQQTTTMENLRENFELYVGALCCTDQEYLNTFFCLRKKMERGKI